ncbi:helix-turn-helix domain-containing protein [Paludifilum halophilum]|uniref:Sigma-54 factor interaction domain-containing protein n=1 Tax=Paludifilum halophilum TaxID=1642702 RepID=A0A235BAS3_9BACL|nr:helix-turn-helix domain-containing protein [Paludifilum halophilum]OYD08977.1 hypothetical protein CHM34_04160 [Paludifilum halophilum]
MEDYQHCRAAKEIMEAAFDSAYEGIIITDPEGRVTMLNETYARFLQVKVEEVIGRHVREVVENTRMHVVARTGNLEKMVRENRFREDLFYRINVVTLSVPPLRERVEDLPELSEHVLKELSREVGIFVQGIADEAMDILVRYHWPGNVRELKNVLERALHLTDGPAIRPEHLPFHLLQERRETGSPFALKEAVERETFRSALQAAGGNREQAIRLLGISQSGFYQKMKKYGLN